MFSNKYQVVKQNVMRGGSCIAFNLVRSKVPPNTEYACKVIGILQQNEVFVHRKVEEKTINVTPRLIDVIEDEQGKVCMIMEHCKGGTLTAYIGSTEEAVRRVIRRCLEILVELHAMDVIHNDVKPENFVVCDNEVIKVIDFGISALASVGNAHTSRGTPWYMAPETLSGIHTFKSDVWAIGVMAYQLLTGRFPFNDKYNTHSPHVYAIWKSVLEDEADLFGLSSGAQEFLSKLLTKDLAKRPTAEEALKLPWVN
jgi:calcium-dependent protein kinase